MKYSVVIAVVCVALVGELTQASPSSSQEWLLFKSQHGKSYESPAEDARRFAIFMETKQRVESHNARGDSSFEMGLNHLSDWTQEELAKLNGFKVDENTLLEAEDKMNETDAYLAEILGSSHRPVPAELDWRKVPGRVTAVKDQGLCASCWAFAAVGVLEGQEIVRVFNETAKVVQLSEQELVDCSRWNNGCTGGMVSTAFDDLKMLGGIVSNLDYPYTAQAGKCALDTKKVVMKDSGHVVMHGRNEKKLKKLLSRYGPISVALDASDDFHSYKSGVLDDKKCSHKVADLNRALLLVGYGTDPEQGHYWIAKNSWSPSWGEQGYIRIKRGVNMCGIANVPTIPKFRHR